ncbi:tetratricopeptide repeat protein [Terrilactibacillus sp. BCM23-1]|uniref:Tetratricopeptide repeat protein n=1 Tax=Terrilactibacillus tamarindi TaxID=2599694 RepID=A0A6N8CMM2_9BACI|nr:tetratricopeptide repeat protein [Terrilactibacillus tamarindi]MTT31282.1 tetratricopeptide repeat protein [Terrilactibacillus tamarindi]
MDDIQLAMNMIDTGQTEDGLSLLKDCLKKADDTTAFQIANIYQDYGLIDNAETVYERLLKRYPNDSTILLQMAELHIDKDEEGKAIEALTKIHKLDENYLSAQLLLADLYQLEGLDEVAEQKLLSAHKMAPSEAVISFALGEFYMSIGEPKKAIDYYKQVLNAESLSHENISLKLAEALSLAGDFEQAMIYYQKGLENDKNLDGLFGYAVTASQLHKYQTVVTALEELRKLDPQYSTLYPLLAKAYDHEGALEEALKVLEDGLKQDEFNERLYAEAGDFAAKLHDWIKADAYYKKAYRLNPESTEILIKYIEIKVELEEFEDIIDILEENKQDDPMLTWYLATAYMKCDRLEEAKACYKICYEHFSQNAEFLNEYGEVMWELGDRQHALTYLEKALQYDPENQNLQSFVERIKEDF